MKKEEVSIYQEIQRNAQNAMAALDTIAGKVYDDKLAMQISRQALKYSDLRNRSVDRLLSGKAEVCKENPVFNVVHIGGIHANTALNTSTGHVAEILIKESNQHIVDICRVMNRFPDSHGPAVELAKELMDFEEKNIQRLKRYL